MPISKSPLAAGFVTFLSCALSAAVALAADSSSDIPSQYLIGKSPTRTNSGIEKPQLDGAFYAEVFPIFNGSGGNLSFLRLGNNNDASSTFHVTVLGAPSGDVYGEGDYTVAGHASIQKGINEVLGDTASSALVNGDTSYSVYLNNNDQDTFFQSVIYNGGNNFFEDVTICPVGASLQGDKTITNVHTSKLAGNLFPETLYIHNLLETQAEYKVVVRDSATGLVLGTIPSLKVGANSTYATPFSFFEGKVTMPATVVHATLEFHAAPGSQFESDLGAGPDPADIGVILGAAVYNSTYNAFLNLSNKCRINR